HTGAARRARRRRARGGGRPGGRRPPDRQHDHPHRRRGGRRRPRRCRRPHRGGPVRRTMMKSKIHRARVTGADLNYVGSISLDPALMELADILEWEKVAVLDIDNGARFETYAIVGGPGEVTLNGAAAGLSVTVLTKGELAASATRYAQGGVAAALSPADSPTLHFSDTLSAGGGLCDPEAVRILVGEGPDRLRELMALGASFDRTGD